MLHLISGQSLTKAQTMNKIEPTQINLLLMTEEGEQKSELNLHALSPTLVDAMSFDTTHVLQYQFAPLFCPLFLHTDWKPMEIIRTMQNSDNQ